MARFLATFLVALALLALPAWASLVLRYASGTARTGGDPGGANPLLLPNPPLDFTAAIDQLPGQTVTTTETLAVSVGAATQVRADNGAVMIVNGSARPAGAAVDLANGDTLRLRLDAPALPGQTTQVTLTHVPSGTRVGGWSVATHAVVEPTPLSVFTDQPFADINTEYRSGITIITSGNSGRQVQMTASAGGLVLKPGVCAADLTGSPAATVSYVNDLGVRCLVAVFTTGGAYSTPASVQVGVPGRPNLLGTWTVTTGPQPDYAPDPFVIQPTLGESTSAPRTLGPFTIAGINQPVTLSITPTGAAFGNPGIQRQTSPGVFAAPATALIVNNGDVIQLAATSSSSFATTVNYDLEANGGGVRTPMGRWTLGTRPSGTGVQYYQANGFVTGQGAGSFETIVRYSYTFGGTEPLGFNNALVTNPNNGSIQNFVAGERTVSFDVRYSNALAPNVEFVGNFTFAVPKNIASIACSAQILQPTGGNLSAAHSAPSCFAAFQRVTAVNRNQNCMSASPSGSQLNQTTTSLSQTITLDHTSTTPIDCVN